MRVLIALLLLLLAVAGASPACAHVAPGPACDHAGGARHDACDHATCIGCATPLPDPVDPADDLRLPAAVTPVAVIVLPLAGMRPDAEAPPPRRRA